MRTTLHTTPSTPSTTTKTSLLAPETAAASGQRSPWHSPMPYLFGGLAAMLGLIAFALLILACSYWKLSRDNNNSNGSEDSDLENGHSKGDGSGKMNGWPVFEEKIVVIMAGNDKPTFLAIPAVISSKQNISVLPESMSKDCGNESCSSSDEETSQRRK